MRRHHDIAIRLLLLIWTAAFASGPAQAAEQPSPAGTPTLSLSACQLQQTRQLQAVSGECGYLVVPEDHSHAGGRTLRLFVARIAAVNRQRAPDPVFVLAGGPGMGASDFYTSTAAAFARIRRDRDIILVDQRGTGKSQALHCEIDDESLNAGSAATLQTEVARCQAQLSSHADLRQYTTSVAVRDLDAVRSALGYQQINLYGISYGTRVAQHYARRYPQQTRALILDGVVSPQMILGPALALDAQAALNRLFARCGQDVNCQQRFGDVQQSLQSLRARLQRQPVTVSVADPLSGKPDDLQVTEQALAVLLRLASYSSITAALLPLTVHLAARDNQFLPLANQLLLTTRSVSDVMAYGMHNSVVCAEDVPRFGAHLDTAALAVTYLGSSQVEALQTLCAHWPRGQVDERFYQPLQGDWPVLLLSGSADPVTPAQYARQAAAQLRHAVQIVLPDQGHGQLGAPCMDRVMADFLQRAAQPEQTAQLDRSCLDKVKPAAFFLSLTGAAP